MSNTLGGVHPMQESASCMAPEDKKDKVCGMEGENVVAYGRLPSTAPLSVFLELASSMHYLEVGREGTPGRYISPRFIDTSLSDLLGRPSLRHAIRSSAIQNNFHKTLDFYL